MDIRRTSPQNAQLALLLEVSSTPKPGNVDRAHEYPDLRFEQFLAGAVGTHEGFERAANGRPIGQSFERAIAGMSNQSGGNTQFGAVLLCIPLVATMGRATLSRDSAREVVSNTTVDDTVNFFSAFDHVSVAVEDPPAHLDDLDVRRGSRAESAIRERNMTLQTLMRESEKRDGIAAEWVNGFSRTFETADAIERLSGPVTDRAATVFIELLASEVDTFVVTQHGQETAEMVRNEAQAVLDGSKTVAELSDEFVDRRINPGTTADIVAGGLYVALERGLEV